MRSRPGKARRCVLNVRGIYVHKTIEAIFHEKKTLCCFVHKNRPDEFIHMDKIFIYIFTVWTVIFWVPALRGKYIFSAFFRVFILSIEKHGAPKVNLLEIRSRWPISITKDLHMKRNEPCICVIQDQTLLSYT